ncbi:unnamed protein product [Notodromas monacha]|uniref:Uncharacterized protein n=1 Tax=Notodromas monacha TaxID=399045 RepID=A0A7R9BWS1_9CRUS|nr:unnamed protein product [Notodromas monacha]CAG0922817.1 unnamed protein product [Notodromas monacha]
MGASPQGANEEPRLSYTRADRPKDAGDPTADYVSIPLSSDRSYHFAMTGKTFEVLTSGRGHPSFDRLLSKCVVFARMSPEQKQLLVERLQELGYHVVPHDFNEVLEKYTEKGYRVLAVAHRRLDSFKYLRLQRASREELETSLTLMGLIVLENRLKPATGPVIEELKLARVRVIMVTGDNILTALSVARECGMVAAGEELYVVGASPQGANEEPRLSYTRADRPKDAGDPTADYVSIPLSSDRSYHFAMTGKTFEVLTSGRGHPSFDRLLSKCVVFARMSPEQKQLLVERLQELGYHVGMCGDGANDCGALKAAHAGISLSEAEASVASPFTSKTPDISCVPTLIREGRAALVTSFGVFKYMAAYSLTQFVSVMLLYSIDCNLTDFQFLFIDLVLITLLVTFFGNTRAHDGPLNKRPPPSALAAIAPVLSLLLQVLLVIAFQVAAFFFVADQSWFKPFVPNDADEYASHSNYAVYTVSSFQYVGLVVIFSKGAPYRMPIYTNYPLSGLVAALLAMNVYLTVEPQGFFRSWLELEVPEDHGFRWLMVGAGVIYILMGFLVELLLVGWFVSHKCLPRFHQVERSKKKFLLIEKSLATDVHWPPITGCIRMNTIDSPP